MNWVLTGAFFVAIIGTPVVIWWKRQPKGPGLLQDHDDLNP